MAVVGWFSVVFIEKQKTLEILDKIPAPYVLWLVKFWHFEFLFVSYRIQRKI